MLPYVRFNSMPAIRKTNSVYNAAHEEDTDKGSTSAAMSINYHKDVCYCGVPRTWAQALFILS